MVTEFGAEANRDGPVEEKGTYAFQQDFVNYHLGVYAHEAVAVAARSTGRCRSSACGPTGTAATRGPHPPIHQKGLIALRRRRKKPAFFDVQRHLQGDARSSARGR